MNARTHEQIVADYDAERREAFKRICETFHVQRRRHKEMLKWHREHPSPRTVAEQNANLKAAFAEEGIPWPWGK